MRVALPVAFALNCNCSQLRFLGGCLEGCVAVRAGWPGFMAVALLWLQWDGLAGCLRATLRAALCVASWSGVAIRLVLGRSPVCIGVALGLKKPPSLGSQLVQFSDVARSKISMW